ncbi:MAG: dihydroorotase [Gammaproteobacteria bacterium]|nr:MAG: dihydroorotase [Gammaproteobacteria bacterium]
MSKILLVNATLVNEGRIFESDILLDGDRIASIDTGLSAGSADEVIDVQGCHVLPGLIDDQVHLREPGLTHKATISSESRAAICGGVTSFMEMPNTSPPTTDRAALVDKYARAAGRSFANFAFYLGATNDNLEELQRVTSADACGIKIFMGASTGNMLVDDHDVLEKIFANAALLVATHCEDSPTIRANEERFRKRFGEDVPISAHPEIRSAEACYKSSSFAVELAKRHATRLHVLHLTTARELELFDPGPVETKHITAEVCVHHLWFDESRYADQGARIKCNPAIKTAEDRDGLIRGVQQDLIDVIATDHAPHTRQEKEQTYFKAPAGLPLIQHSLQMLLQQYHGGVFTLEEIVTKVAHNPARLFRVVDRGFLREGYYADLVVVDLSRPYDVTPETLQYKCGWSPLEGVTFSSSIVVTVVNGAVVFKDGVILDEPRGRALEFLAE